MHSRIYPDRDDCGFTCFCTASGARCNAPAVRDGSRTCSPHLITRHFLFPDYVDEPLVPISSRHHHHHRCRECPCRGIHSLHTQRCRDVSGAARLHRRLNLSSLAAELPAGPTIHTHTLQAAICSDNLMLLAAQSARIASGPASSPNNTAFFPRGR